jgi:beta-galactosidase/beta-glucuronidase
VFDPSQKGEQPRGKQSAIPSGDWYTDSTGIWQTVWLEPVPAYHVKTLQIDADYHTGHVTILPILNTPQKDLSVVAEAFDGTKSVAKCYGGSDGPLLMRFDPSDIQPWSPDSPHMYELHIQLLHRNSVVDEVRSDFAFRKIEVVKGKNGSPCLSLNGKRLFLMGVTDQGYWPDGLYTAPSVRAQQMDVRIAKSLGFNVIRKFQKIEPESWYVWCDKMGILVWQDMPNGENKSSASQQQFQMELQRMIQSRSHHPSIMAWTIFHEGRGQHNVPEYVDMVRSLDPTRLVNAASGWTDSKLGDFNVSHKFPGPEMPAKDDNRIAIIGLFGGLTLVPPPEHLWTENTWGHQHVSDSNALVQRYKQMHEELRQQIRTQGLAGAFFHQLTDVESECNGLTPYDRRSLKVPKESLEQINRETIRIGSE